MQYYGFGFYFEKAGRGGEQGAIAPAEQFFEGSLAEISVAREFGQNSLDNPLGDGPVTMQLELRRMAVDDIPGIDELRPHFEAAELATRGESGHERMRRALELSGEDQLWVLRVSDYGTTGLTGSESITQSKKSPLVALTRGDGISANDGERGGSFGIGSAVGPMASDLCTVLYTSLASDKSEVVFAAHSRLASHNDASGVRRRADGYFTELSNEDDLQYLRGPGQIGPFAERTELGTDVFILGYRKAEDDSGLTNIRDAFVRNFMIAISRGKLIVQGRSPDGAWTLNADTLSSYLDAESAAFYRAMHDPEPYEREVPGLGMLKLFVEIDDGLPKKLNTITVRTPLMKIHTFRSTSIPVKYAAILDASNAAANEKLRKLEPPQHDQWDRGRSPEGPGIVAALQKFIREGLASKLTTQVGRTIEIKGLDRMLPAELWDRGPRPSGNSGEPTAGDGEHESATQHGKPTDERTAELNHERKAVAVTIRKPATAGEGEDIDKGRDRGGKGKERGGGQGLPGQGGESGGRSRIRARAVTLRSWTDDSTGDLIVAIRPREAVTGDLTLAALGPGGALIRDYELPIAAATMDGQEHQVIETEGNTLRDISLIPSESPTVIRLRLNGQHRYMLGVN
ncbi:hypothetical protein PROP_01307 [Propionicimonas sp. T2.31MG-18]|uniref:hypothetical protein n=1 Tax=Propionicimonas sp. T2.31MG-18 TaxID=3157620 RepID=UPI0035ECFC98